MSTELTIAVKVVLATVLATLFFSFWNNIVVIPYKKKLHVKFKNDIVQYLVSFISYLWLSYGFFVLYKHLQPPSFGEVYMWGIGLWIFLYFFQVLKHSLCRRENFRICLLTSVGEVGPFIIMSALTSNLGMPF